MRRALDSVQRSFIMLRISDRYHTFKLVSIDPGLNNIGAAVFDISLEKDSFKITRILAETLQEDRVVDQVCYDIEKDEERHYKRIRMVSALMRLIRHHRPSVVVCESPFFNATRPSSYAVLVEVIMEIQMSVYQYDNAIRFSLFAPQLVKKSLGVAGQKGKEVVREAMAKNETLIEALDGDLDSLDEHSVDAIAVGYTFLTRFFKD